MGGRYDRGVLWVLGSIMIVGAGAGVTTGVGAAGGDAVGGAGDESGGNSNDDDDLDNNNNFGSHVKYRLCRLERSQTYMRSFNMDGICAPRAVFQMISSPSPLDAPDMILLMYPSSCTDERLKHASYALTNPRSWERLKRSWNLASLALNNVWRRVNIMNSRTMGESHVGGCWGVP